MLLGVGVGLIIGILPGLGGIAGMSILLPFVYGMDTVSALALLIGLLAVVPTGDTFSSIRWESRAARLRRRRSSTASRWRSAARPRARSAAFFSSMLGGLFARWCSPGSSWSRGRSSSRSPQPSLSC